MILTDFLLVMSTTTTVCAPTDDLIAAAKKFRFRKAKTVGALFMKADQDSLSVDLEDEVHEDISIEDIAEKLPTSEPRYLLISYVLNHSDGRVSYPLCFVFYTPPTASSTLKMLYSASKTFIEQKVNATKSFELRDSDELDDEWLMEELSRV